MVLVIKMDEIKDGEKIIAKAGIMIDTPGGRTIIPQDEIIPTVQKILTVYQEIKGVK